MNAVLMAICRRVPDELLLQNIDRGLWIEKYCGEPWIVLWENPKRSDDISQMLDKQRLL